MIIFQFNALKIFNAINAVAELGSATTLTTPASAPFFLTRSAFIQLLNIFTTRSNGRRFRRALPTLLQHQARLKRARKRYCARSSCSSITRTKARAVPCIISYQSTNETTCMQCCGQLSHAVTKKAIKAALKLCMHVIYYQGCKLVRGEKGDKLNSTPPPPLPIYIYIYIYIHTWVGIAGYLTIQYNHDTAILR